MIQDLVGRGPPGQGQHLDLDLGQGQDQSRNWHPHQDLDPHRHQDQRQIWIAIAAVAYHHHHRICTIYTRIVPQEEDKYLRYLLHLVLETSPNKWSPLSNQENRVVALERTEGYFLSIFPTLPSITISIIQSIIHCPPTLFFILLIFFFFFFIFIFVIVVVVVGGGGVQGDF